MPFIDDRKATGLHFIHGWPSLSCISWRWYFGSLTCATSSPKSTSHSFRSQLTPSTISTLPHCPISSDLRPIRRFCMPSWYAIRSLYTYGANSRNLSQTNIGDGVIIWRVYAFYSSRKERLVLLIPLAFLLGSICASSYLRIYTCKAHGQLEATSITLTYCSARLGAGIELGTYQHPAFCRNIQMASYCTALATTAVATALISYKAW